ncbi:MAG TPA: hypothetical protein VK422_06815 [Pyrinomonadaceae bacterium]|nr:hypothetical protein [Pyrinomonadaceae bacterium]
MFTALQIIMAVLAGGVLLALVSEGFAAGLSRAFEAAADAVEYRLALRARGRAGREVGVERGTVYALGRVTG